MATQHGMSTCVMINALVMSAFFNDASANGACDAVEDTAFGDTSKTYIAGLHDGTMSLSGFFDPVASGSDATLATALGTADTLVSILWQGDTTVGGRAAIAKAIQTSHDTSAPVGDVVACAAEVQGDGGVWGGDVLLGRTAVIVTGFGAGVDNGVATTDGWVANLHIDTISGTSTPTITAKVADSADNVTFADLSGGGFAAKTAIGSEQIAGTGTVARYARAAYTISGTNPSFTGVMVLARK